MPADLKTCEKVLPVAVNKLFEADPRVQAVGIARHGKGYGFKAVKNVATVRPQFGGTEVTLPNAVYTVPVQIETVRDAVVTQSVAPRRFAASYQPEQDRHRPLVCGLQIQNWDDDERRRESGAMRSDYYTLGTLGGFVRLTDGKVAILSNNHVLAGENRGQPGVDRVQQPGGLGVTATHHVATLSNFVPIQPSPHNAQPGLGNVVFNVVDAAVGGLKPRVRFAQKYLTARKVPPPKGTAVAQLNDRVFKVGRTTGLTFGVVTAISATVGRIPYDPGPCWFSRQIEVQGEDGTIFSDSGDSGSLVVRESGEVVGLLFAGNGTHTYVCPIATVLTELNCSLA
jgi:hypothetical protein